MGFEQLAALKKQLAKQRADAKPQGKPQDKPSGGKPARSPKPARQSTGKPVGHGGGAPAAGKSSPAPSPARRPALAADAKPVNPTVLAIGKLQRRFPVAFPKSPAPKVPLKIGIFKDLVTHTAELGLDEAQLRDAIKEWCRGSRYWACLVDGAARVDLTGTAAGTVTAQQAAGAVRLDAARRSRAAGKAKAGGDAKRGADKGASDPNATKPASTPAAPAQPAAAGTPAPDVVSNAAPDTAAGAVARHGTETDAADAADAANEAAEVAAIATLAADPVTNPVTNPVADPAITAPTAPDVGPK